jgi:hypothetical protein
MPKEIEIVMGNQYLDAFFSGDGDLRVLTACPFCNTHYSIRAARVLAQKDDAHVVHIECRHCGGSIVALVLAGGGVGLQSVGVVTDLTRDEVVRFSGSPAVSSDDTLDMHEFLIRNDSLSVLLSHRTS